MTISASTGPTRPVDLLPIFRSLVDAFAVITAETVEKTGGKISCQHGCAACCRQLVPITEIEARRIGEMVSAMPEPRRSEIRVRFEAARSKLQDAGLLERLLAPETVSQAEFVPFALGYFRHAIPCPFLEEESCSIYPERPIACREYLVTTPAENCSNLNPKTVKAVNLGLDVRKAMARLDSDQPSAHGKWIPLILATAWADAHPDQSPPRPGTELLREFFSYLSGQEIPEAEGPAGQ